MASMDELAAKLHHILNVVDNNERRRVEADVVSSLSNPITLTMLVHILCKSEADAATGTPAMSAGVRQLAAVLLRKKIFSLWAALDANAQAELKQLLLHQLGVEPVRTVRLAVAHIVMRLAKADAQEEGGGWPELQQAVRVAAEDPRVEMRELAMVLVYSFAEVYSEGSSFGGLAAEAVVRGVCDGELIVQQAAVKAAGMLLPALEQNSSKLLQQFLQELIPVCLRVLEEQSAVEAKASLCVAVVDVLECALEVMSVKKHSQILVALAQRLLPILMQPSTYSRVRQSVATALGNLVEAKPKMVVAQHLLEPLVQSCMALMAEDNTISMPDEAGEVEDDADDDDDDDVDMLHASTPCMLGGRLLSAIAGAVPSKTFTAVLLPFLQTATDPTNAATTDPRVKKSGMVALSCLAEGNPGYLRRRVGYVLETARLFMLDANPIPREAAAFSLTYVCQHLQPEILTHHAELFPMLLPLLADENDAVRRRVAEALDTLCENVEEHLELYVDAILPAVLSAISCSTIPTQVKLCGVLSSMAMTRCPAFARHGVEVLELLKQPLTLSSPETTALRAQATETVGVVGSAMGKAAFEPYFPFFMNIIVENLRTNNAPLREQSFGFLANISELLGADFLPYLDDSIACALQSVEADKATYTNKHLLAGGDTSMAGALAHDDAGADDDSDAVSEDSAMEVHMRVRTADVEEKSSAVYALGVFADALGPLFTMERVQHCWDAITSLDGHYYLNVRANALTTAAKLAKASAGTTEVVRSLTENTLPQESRDLVDELVCGMLLSTIRQDDEKEVVAAACEALTLLLKFFGPQTFPNGPDEVVRVLLQLLRGKMPCQVDQEDSGDSDSDSEVGGAEKQDAASLLLDANGNNNGHMAHIIDAYLKGEAPPPLHADPAAGVADWKASLTAEMLLENLDLPGDHEDVLMDVVCEMLEAVAKAYGPSFAPYLVFIYPMLTYYASVEERPAEDVVMASGSLAAVLQALGEECRNYAEPSMHLALHIITSSEESTARANGAYLTRVLVEQCPTLFTADQGTVPLVLQALWSLVERRGDAEEVPEAVDNAISATCSLVRCVAPSVLPLDSIVPPMLLGIPMAVDKSENTNAARTVVHLLRELHDVSLRATWLPEVVAAAARLLASPAVEAAAKQQVGEAAVAFRGWHAEAWTSACATLSPEHQQLLVGLGL